MLRRDLVRLGNLVPFGNVRPYAQRQPLDLVQWKDLIDLNEDEVEDQLTICLI